MPSQSLQAAEPPLARLSRVGVVYLCILLTGGCASRWHPSSQKVFCGAEFSSPLVVAQQLRQRGCQRWHANDVGCIDDLTESIRLLWPLVYDRSLRESTPALHCYNDAVKDLIDASYEFGCFNPQLGIKACAAQRASITLPIQYEGFTWGVRDYRCLQTVSPYDTTLDRKTRCGLGVPLLAFHNRCRDQFFDPEVPFAATAIVAPSAVGGRLTLHVVNPLVLQEVDSSEAINATRCSLSIANDLTAPLAFVESRHSSRDYLRGFFEPGSAEAESGLVMLHPHETNRIPVVVVHGLISDPLTWLTLMNELQTEPEIRDRFEFWAFYYPTGTPFSVEAARLRTQLRAARHRTDPYRMDPSLDQMVLIGHSMGGLVSKLQITESGRAIERSLNLTTSELRALPDEAQRAIYWHPVASVRRTIFIATPHRGSELASRPIGRFASRLVQLNGSSMESVTEFVDSSRNWLTADQQKLPTSIDMLRPEDPTLTAIARLPVSPRVTMHSIIGCGHGGVLRPEGDGVVPIFSARHACVESELFVESGHDVHRRPQAVAEVKRILIRHARTAY